MAESSRLPTRMRALVTGGAGFIGSALVDSLLARGDEVTVLDDLSTGRRSNLDDALARGARLVEGDVRDAGAVASAIDGGGVEVVFHLAAQIDVRRSVADPRFDLDVNAGGTLQVLEASRAKTVTRLVFASTGGAIYGEGDGRELPLTEDAERVPDAPYGQSKNAAEGYVGLYARLHGLSTAALRLANVYGPRQDPLGEAGVAAIFSGALLEGRTPTVFGDGLQTRDYVYVGDVVDAFVAASSPATPTGAFNVGTGVETNVIELGEALAASAGVPFEPEHAPPRLGEVRRIAIDPSLAGRELGWKPRVSLEEGLARTVEWARGVST
jgi:UDP-glucose 4-epimerase